MPSDFQLFSWFLVFHSVKSVHIRSFSGPFLPAFGLNTERYPASLRIQSECGKIRTRKTPNTDTFYAMLITVITLNNYPCSKPWNVMFKSFDLPVIIFFSKWICCHLYKQRLRIVTGKIHTQIKLKRLGKVWTCILGQLVQ